MRAYLKRQLSRLPFDTLERALALSLLANKYDEVEGLRVFDKREDLWADLLVPYVNEPITLLEFGVFRGYSMREFARLNTNPKSRFFGFDSFRGLPEDWFKTMEKGMFDVDGEAPQIDDQRVSFVKGWFQNTVPGFLAETRIEGRLVVHHDADLYSATMFVLLEIDRLKRPYDAIFDEFTGHETRALHNYQQITGAKVEFIGKVMNYDFPEQVTCRITPCVTYEV